MKRLLITSLVVTAVMSSCQQEFQSVSEDVSDAIGYVAYTESFAEATKTSLDENYSVLWSAEDRIAIFEGITLSSEYAVHESSVGTPNGSFQKVESQGGGFVSGNEIPVNIAVYPYASAMYCLNGETQGSFKIKKVNLPAEQYYQPGSFGVGSFVMAAITKDVNDNILRFKNVGGSFQLQLTGTVKVKDIVLMGNSGESIAGNAAVTVYSDGVTMPLMEMEADAVKSIRLDCGDGVQLDETVPTSFFIALAPTDFAGGFTVHITDTEGGTGTLTTTKANPVERSKTLRMPPVRFEPVPAVTGPADLSAEGTANCYIVQESGSYKFKAVKGNSDESVGAVASAEVLWKTFSTSVIPTEDVLVTSAEYTDGYVTFEVPESFDSGKDGNVVIAAKNASGKILWSWHIWLLKDKIVEHEMANNAGTLMDRNLGAYTATPGLASTLGLVYQWGRKDPFPGSTSTVNKNSIAATTFGKATSWPAYIYTTEENGNVEYTIANPTTMIFENGDRIVALGDGRTTSVQDWMWTPDPTLWQKEKTMYDPCPVGWKVPPGGYDNLWYIASGKNGFASKIFKKYDTVNKGLVIIDKDENEIFYPAIDKKNTNTTITVGAYGKYWSSTATIGSANTYAFGTGGISQVYSSSEYQKTFGFPIRCCRE